MERIENQNKWLKKLSQFLPIVLLFGAQNALAAKEKRAGADEIGEGSGVEANKEQDRSIVRGMKMVPGGSKGERPNLDEMIGDWAPDGHVYAMKIAAKPGGKASGTMDLTPLQQLPRLGKLELAAVAIPDLKAVAGLKLKELKLNGLAKVKSLSELTQVNTLEKLRVENMPEAQVDSLRGAASVQELELVDDGVTNIGFVTSMPELTKLDLSGNKGLTDIRDVAQLKNLRFLSLVGTGVKDLSALAQLEGLKILRVSRGVNTKVVEALKDKGLRIEVH